MALTLTDLRDGMERQLRSVEAQQRRHGLLKDGGPTSTPRTERLQHLEPRVTQRPRHGKHMGARTDRTDASAQRQRTQRSTSRNTARSTARESVGSDTARLLDATRTAGSMKVATLRGQLKQTLRERHDAEKEVRRLAKELEKMSTGYGVFGHVGRDPDHVVSTARKEELRTIMKTYADLGLEHERRRVLEHAEADKAQYMKSLKK